MNKPWKLVVLLVGIFIAGGVTAVLVTHRVRCKAKPAPAPVAATPPPQPPSAEKWTKGHLKLLTEEVLVEASKLEDVRPIIAQRMAELFEMRRQYLEANRALRQTMEREVAAKLSAEQKEKYEQLNHEFHERAKRMERGERAAPATKADAKK